MGLEVVSYSVRLVFYFTLEFTEVEYFVDFVCLEDYWVDFVAEKIVAVAVAAVKPLVWQWGE
jgi:hypothetical protein